MLLAVGVCCQEKQWQASNQRTRYHNSNNDHPNSYGVSRQFAHFAGPVSGAEHQVLVPRASVHAHTQYQGAPAGMAYDYVVSDDFKCISSFPYYLFTFLIDFVIKSLLNFLKYRERYCI